MISYSKLPRAGLGNKLFVWAQGFVFANCNGYKHVTLGWIKLHIGPILRKEKSSRLYLGYFDTRIMVANAIYYLINIFRSKKYLRQEDCNKIIEGKFMFTFNELPHSNDYFLVLKSYRDVIKEGFLKYIHKSVLDIYMGLESPAIGVHIRLGDFKLSNMNEDMDFFIQVINRIRTLYNEDLKVTIFSDGSISELEPILKLKNIELASHNKDLLELLHLSKSKILILSSKSTFSQWAGFLSDGALIYDRRIIPSRIRAERDLMEIDYSEIDDLLLTKV